MTITLSNMNDWNEFFAANSGELLAQYETEAAALKAACEGGIIVSGGAAPAFYVSFTSD